jgi:hypothetical protein
VLFVNIADIQSEDQALEWLKHYQMRTKTEWRWRKKAARPVGQTNVLFRVSFALY